MAALLPFIPFNPALETWDSYIIHFKCVLEADDFTNVADNQKRALFLNYCNMEIFEMTRALLATLSVQTVPWNTLQGKLWDHYAPRASHITH